MISSVNQPSVSTIDVQRAEEASRVIHRDAMLKQVNTTVVMSFVVSRDMVKKKKVQLDRVAVNLVRLEVWADNAVRNEDQTIVARSLFRQQRAWRDELIRDIKRINAFLEQQQLSQKEMEIVQNELPF